MPSIRLIVGLGNPGPRYTDTRHNMGARCVRAFARRFAIPLVHEGKFQGELGRGRIADHDVRLLLPATYMNLSGDAVGAVARFYKIEAVEILVAYDEVAFEPGVVKLKTAGGYKRSQRRPQRHRRARQRPGISPFENRRGTSW